MSEDTPQVPVAPGNPWKAKIISRIRELSLWALGLNPDYFLMALGIILLAGLVSFATVRLLPSTLASGSFVTFDVIKLGNAERAVASGLLGNTNGSADDALLLTEASKQVLAAINKEAAGRLVLIKQAVVEPNSAVSDITDAVLVDLNLPVTVPTVSNQTIISDDSFVSSAYQQGPINAAESVKHKAELSNIYWRNHAADATQKLVP